MFWKGAENGGLVGVEEGLDGVYERKMNAG